MSTNERLHTPEEIAARLQVKPTTIRAWLRSGKLKGVRIGPKLWRVSERDLAEFLQRHRND
jgi:excisionase family DNA binding protein